MEEYEIIFFKKTNGEIPVQEFLDSLDVKMRSKMLTEIDKLRKKGNTLRRPDSKHLADGIFELRAIRGGNISRVLFFFIFERQIVLTNGFIKKTRKTPKSEIERASRYRNEYLDRIENGKEKSNG